MPLPIPTPASKHKKALGVIRNKGDESLLVSKSKNSARERKNVNRGFQSSSPSSQKAFFFFNRLHHNLQTPCPRQCCKTLKASVKQSAQSLASRASTHTLPSCPSPDPARKTKKNRHEFRRKTNKTGFWEEASIGRSGERSTSRTRS